MRELKVLEENIGKKFLDTGLENYYYFFGYYTKSTSNSPGWRSSVD